MTASWLHATILATAIAATAAIGFAGAASLMPTVGAAAKSDRLPVTAGDVAYRTVETRSNGTSVLTRMPIAQN